MADGRRKFLQQLGAAAAASSFLPLLDQGWWAEVRQESLRLNEIPAEKAASEEDFWGMVRKAYYPPADFINLENGYFSPCPRPVFNRMRAYQEEVNQLSSFYMRTRMHEEKETLRLKLAEFSGVSTDEIAFTRNTTESLDILIHGMNLKPGDEVITTHQDYGSMLEAFDQQAERVGFKVNRIQIPVVPENASEYVDAFRAAITDKTKVILVTHLINLNGQILPAREITEMARKSGIEVIVDGAHSFAHLDFRLPDLDCDYFGCSLHKWLGAPLGNGLLFVRKHKIKDIWPLFGDTGKGREDIRKFEHQGTRPPADYLAISDAIDFHQTLGGEKKEARLRYLKNYWAEQVKDVEGVQLNTSLNPAHSCAIANIAIEGMEPKAVSETLMKDHGIFTVAIQTKQIKGVRVTPHLYNTLEELDQLAAAIRQLAAKR